MEHNQKQTLLARLKKGAEGSSSLGFLPTCALQNSRCPRCKGVGAIVSTEAPVAKAALCACVSECARCGGQARRIENQKSKPCRLPEPRQFVGNFNFAHIPSKYAQARLENYSNFSGNGKAIIQQINSWLQQCKQHKPAKGVILGGPIGVGKTFALASIANELIIQGYSVRFVDFFHLLATLRSTYSSGESDREILNPLEHCDVLIIDELGKGRNSEWEQTVLDSLVMARYNSNKVIVASTNYSLFAEPKQNDPFHLDLYDKGSKGSQFSPDVFESLEQRVGKRIFSRLVEMSIFMELSGEDYRRVGKLLNRSAIDSSNSRRS